MEYEASAGTDSGVSASDSTTQPKWLVLDDYTVGGSPDEWARKVAAAVEAYNADFIVAEKNYGGENVMTVMQHEMPSMPIRRSWATGNKQYRADPVAQLYQQDRVHHTKGLRDLEREMIAWAPDMKYLDSPHRMDALVWALTEMSANERRPDYSDWAVAF